MGTVTDIPTGIKEKVADLTDYEIRRMKAEACIRIRIGVTLLCLGSLATLAGFAAAKVL